MIYFISVGSNVDGKREIVARAIDRLAELVDDLTASDFYITPALNGRDADYLNAVVRCTTSIEVDEMNSLLKRLEADYGRSSESKLSGQIPLDLDIVIADTEVMRPVDASREYFLIGYNQILQSSTN